jgi:hypothetical protein
MSPLAETFRSVQMALAEGEAGLPRYGGVVCVRILFADSPFSYLWRGCQH